MIVADDLGYSDLGCFGSEIATPNINALALQGQIFTNFYTAATCSPSRAMLLSGTDNHIAGLGNMAENVSYYPEQVGKPGYEGFLNNRVVCVAQLMKDAGYHTYISGKWHLGLTKEQSPSAKGFERCFALLDAAANHFAPDRSQSQFWEDGSFAQFPPGKYSTDFYTDKSIEFIEKDRVDNRPFFLYAAYTAPHWPLQAPTDFIEKYKGVYDIGYDSLRTFRFESLKEKGIVLGDVQLPPLPRVKGSLYNISNQPLLAWSSLSKSEQKIESRKMEIYAGMIENLDQNIGRLIQYLKVIGEYENTLFVFLSDNGPDVFELNETPNPSNPYPYMGTANSFIAYGPQWAHASSAVNSYYKGYSAEGGIHSPMIIKMPFQNEGRGIVKTFTTIMDLAPTFLDVAGATYPPTNNGKSLAKYKGSSLLPFLEKKKSDVHKDDYVMGWELFGRCAIRKGKWKIRKMEPPFGKAVFELFDIDKDPTESYDLSSQYPAKYKEMLIAWKTYVKENGVILKD
ncbi:arylsulfatase [Segetibacter aerophilus]|uniref:Arylsulfatase n=1 Tax=Segetibacter aerophilus TaxID=670293 RepID=A0A512BE18_9BACT|nr:arylsulfatase [Segetibacter aerophilus]GEO10097.1 arylsulfatase [Segetibacter aerophilus]